jgi:hypothetical protein
MTFSLVVIAGHSRSKNGVASLAYARQSMGLCGKLKRSMDARVKPGHDD